MKTQQPAVPQLQHSPLPGPHTRAGFISTHVLYTPLGTVFSLLNTHRGRFHFSVCRPASIFTAAQSSRPRTYHKLFNLLRDVCLRCLLFTQGRVKTPYVCHFKKRLPGHRVCAFRCRQSAPSHRCGCPILYPPSQQHWGQAAHHSTFLTLTQSPRR